MSLFKKKSLAEDLAQVEETYSEAAQAIEVLEDAAVDGECWVPFLEITALNMS